MLTPFKNDTPKQLDEIRQALQRRDGIAIERAAHTLKGAVGNFCAGPVFQAALRLEQAGRDRNFVAAETSYAALEEVLAQLTPELEALVNPAADAALESS
jgi:HPt (histidine-containing phosphotransfer) domain-containing protein